MPLDVDDTIRKLRKRGFYQDGSDEVCGSCKLKARATWRIASRVGGRDIDWCKACGEVKSWRRSADDKMTEETPFDLAKFLE